MFKSNVTIGIDISDYRLRLAAIQQKLRRTKLHSFSEVELPVGVVTNGIIQQPEQLVELLKQLAKQLGGSRLPHRDVNVGLPEQQTFLTTIPVETIDQTSLEQEALHHFPFEKDDMYFAVEPLKSRHAAALSAGKKEFIDFYLAVLEKAGYRATGLYSEVIAIATALLGNDKNTTGGSIIMDLGQARTTIIFYIDQHIYFSTSYPSVLAQGNLNQANLTAVVQQLLSYYLSHFQEQSALEKIVLCGSGASVPNIDTTIAQLTAVPTGLGNPFSGLKSSGLMKKMDLPLGYTTAIGLALLK